VGAEWVSPLEFWKMPPGQLWWLIRARLPKKAQSKQQANGSLYRMLKEAKARNG